MTWPAVPGPAADAAAESRPIPESTAAAARDPNESASDVSNASNGPLPAELAAGRSDRLPSGSTSNAVIGGATRTRPTRRSSVPVAN